MCPSPSASGSIQFCLDESQLTMKRSLSFTVDEIRGLMDRPTNIRLVARILQFRTRLISTPETCRSLPTSITESPPLPTVL